MEPQHLIGQPMYTDDHCGRQVRLLEQLAPLRDSLPVTGENDCFRRIPWHVHRDLSSTVVLEHVGDKLSGDSPCSLFQGLPFISQFGHGVSQSTWLLLLLCALVILNSSLVDE